MQKKNALREELGARWAGLWPEAGSPDRPPLFSGLGRAAERLRHQPEYLRASQVAVMPDPALLQVRINALQDGKTLIAATPGLKQGLVRISPQDLPTPRRSRELRGGALAKAGRVLRLPGAKLGKVGLLVGAVMAVDQRGNTLGDGRGLLDLFHALLLALGAINPATPLAVLAAEEQVLPALPAEPWDAGANLVLTPERALRLPQAARPAAGLDGLPPALARLPLVKAALISLGRGKPPAPGMHS